MSTASFPLIGEHKQQNKMCKYIHKPGSSTCFNGKCSPGKTLKDQFGYKLEVTKPIHNKRSSPVIRLEHCYHSELEMCQDLFGDIIVDGDKLENSCLSLWLQDLEKHVNPRITNITNVKRKSCTSYIESNSGRNFHSLYDALQVVVNSLLMYQKSGDKKEFSTICDPEKFIKCCQEVTSAINSGELDHCLIRHNRIINDQGYKISVTSEYRLICAWLEEEKDCLLHPNEHCNRNCLTYQEFSHWSEEHEKKIEELCRIKTHCSMLWIKYSID